MPLQSINFTEKFAGIAALWSPRVIAEMNDYQFKLAKVQGDFVWHSHAETDEALNTDLRPYQSAGSCWWNLGVW